MNGPRTAVLVLALGQVGLAQEPTGEPAQPTTPTQELQYARIVAEQVQPRCFASARSPSFDDKLVAGQVVRVGEQVGEFRRVVLPLGVTGYVHKKFAEERDGGMVEASAKNVSFRYRPQTSEVPALVMPQGTMLHYVDEDAEWWKVTNPLAPAYLAVEELQVFESPNQTLAQSFAELERVRRQRWTAAVGAREAKRAAAAALKVQVERLDALTQSFRAMADRPVAEQDFTTLSRDLLALVGELPEGSSEHARAVGLQAAIGQQELVAQALQAVKVEAPKVNRAAEILEPEVPDALGRFDAVGWLRRDAPVRMPERFTLMKGGVLLYVVTCASRRYDLALLEGTEVGIKGTKSRPDAQSVRHLDASKIEILKLAK